MTGTYRLLLLTGWGVWCLGCGSRNGNVTGTVTFQNQPVPFGTIMLFTDGGEIFSALIQEDGNFAIANIPCGQARLAIMTHPDIPSGFKQARPPAQAPFQTPSSYLSQDNEKRSRRFVPIPKKYSDPDRSGLVLAVVADRQTCNIDLRP